MVKQKFAITLKAMSLRPGDRYPSAQALGVEIENYLGDEPVKAYPESLVVRMRRWARKHPGQFSFGHPGVASTPNLAMTRIAAAELDVLVKQANEGPDAGAGIVVFGFAQQKGAATLKIA